MRLVPLSFVKNRRGRCLVSMLITLALVVSSFVLPVHISKSSAAESASSYGLNNPTISNGVTTWDCIYFGNYWQNDTNGDGKADQNDQKEPIKWRVLSVNGNDAFLLTGARQIGKTYLIRQCLKESGYPYIELNFIEQPELVNGQPVPFVPG